MVNGVEDANMRSLAAYVEQSDALLGVLSVRETINFAARLRLVRAVPEIMGIIGKDIVLTSVDCRSLDPSTPARVIRERVNNTIAELGLTDVTNNRIGNAVQRGISGGQKRRVTIGSALVTMPRILILDEPTSGLDSRTSREVMLAST